MRAPRNPYRIAERPDGAPVLEPVDPLGAALRLANHLVLGWALLRVVVCSIRGLDLEGFVAIVILVAGIASLTRSLA